MVSVIWGEISADPVLTMGKAPNVLHCFNSTMLASELEEVVFRPQTEIRHFQMSVIAPREERQRCLSLFDPLDGMTLIPDVFHSQDTHVLL